FRRAMRDRRVWKGERYKPPPSNTLHPEELRREDLAALLDSDESVGRVLARRLGYGPPYADEICIRAGVGAGEPASAMGPEETRRILDSARKVCAMAKGRESPRIYRDSNGVLVGFSPFELLAYSRHSHEEYGTMNQLVDDYFAELEAAEKRAMREKARAEDEEKRRESVRRLKETADEMLRRAKSLREAGSALFGNLGAFQEAVDSARSGKEAATFGPVKLLEATGGKEGKLKVDVSGNVLEFPANADAAKIASSLFDEAKRLERDREKLAAKIGERERMAGRVKEETGAEAPVKRKRKAWYESYRWFTSSDGILVVCARDASSNEALVKKHSKPENPVFHSEVTGAPFVLVQADSEKVPQSTLEEAAQMAASYTTRAWQAGYSSLDVFWVRASQLTKTPPSGEYLGSGAFVVRGRKNYIRGSRLMLAVGAVREEGALRIVAAPERAVASKTATYVRIAPGSIEKRKLAQMVKARLVALAPSDEKREIEAVPTGDISSIMPGKSGEIV
ncbi:MAG: NFACT family protein, partial [Thermoproteota archaeon]